MCACWFFAHCLHYDPVQHPLRAEYGDEDGASYSNTHNQDNHSRTVSEAYGRVIIDFVQVTLDTTSPHSGSMFVIYFQCPDPM